MNEIESIGNGENMASIYVLRQHFTRCLDGSWIQVTGKVHGYRALGTECIGVRGRKQKKWELVTRWLLFLVELNDINGC